MKDVKSVTILVLSMLLAGSVAFGVVEWIELEKITAAVGSQGATETIRDELGAAKSYLEKALVELDESKERALELEAALGEMTKISSEASDLITESTSIVNRAVTTTAELRSWGVAMKVYVRSLETKVLELQGVSW